MVRLLIILAILIFAGPASWAGPEAKVSKGRDQVTVHLSYYKRGLFFGSCGPSTRSLQWEYSVTLTGQGPVFKKGNITLKDGSLETVTIVDGRVSLDETHKTISLDLYVEKDGVRAPFAHNGTYKTKPLG